MARPIEEIDDGPESISRAAPGLPNDPRVLKAALESAQRARKIAEEGKAAADREAERARGQARTALSHAAKLTLMAQTLCERILADGGDLGGLEQPLTELGIEWQPRQESETDPLSCLGL